MNLNFPFQSFQALVRSYGQYLLFIFCSIISLVSVSAQCPPGHVSLNTQAQVNAFLVNYPNCTQINGNLSIVSIPANSITDLSPLANIATVTGTMNVTNTAGLQNLSGLSGLTSIGVNFYIDGNVGLQSIGGMNNLQTIGGFLYVINNSAIQTFNGLHGLQSLGTGFWFNNNDALTQFQAFQSLTTIAGPIVIVENTNLQSLIDFSGVHTNQGFIHIQNNPALTSIYGIHNLNAANITYLYLMQCAQLSICGVQSICDYLNSGTNNFQIYSNLTGCSNKTEILANCVYQPLLGCTNSLAHNYNEDAIYDDGTCQTCTDGIQNGDETGIDCGGSRCAACPVIFGCTNSAAHNYNQSATVDDGSCQTCFDGVLNGTETAVDCGGIRCTSDCPEPPFVSCANVILYVDPHAPNHEGSIEGRDIFLKEAIFFLEGLTTDAPYVISWVKRKSDYLKHDWTTDGACIDGVPNGDKENVDKGKEYRDCIPLIRGDINDGVRKYNLIVWDIYGSYECTGNYWVDTVTYGNYAVPEIQIAQDEDHTDPSPAMVTNRSFEDVSYKAHASPNPGQDVIFVTWHSSSEENARLIISDMSGRTLSHHALTSLEGTNRLQLDMARFSPGLYIFTLQTKDSMETFKWIKSE